MNILIIPSWCPTETNKISGSFFFEQAEFYARAFPEDDIYIISFDEQKSKFLDRRHPVKHAIGWIKRYIFSSSRLKIIQTLNNLHIIECSIPVLRVNTNESYYECIEKHVKHALLYLNSIQWTPDVIHAHCSFPAGYAALKLSRNNIPIIITEHMGPFPWKRYITKTGNLIRPIVKALNSADKLIAVSDRLKDDILKNGIIREISVIGNPVDENKFCISYKKNCEENVFLSVCSPSYQKGTDLLIDAFELFLSKYKINAKLYIVGDSEERIQFQNEVKKRNIDKYIQFTGAIDRQEMVKFYQNADYYVLPSRYESFGVSYIEAMMCGLPVIATRCGGPNTFVNDNNGILVDDFLVESLADVMNKILTVNFDHNAIRNFALSRFSVKNHSQQLKTIYKALL